MRVRRLDRREWRAYRDVRLRALADSPDAFGSLWSRERERPDEHWRERVSSGAESDLDLPLIVEGPSGFQGLAWGRVDREDTTTVHVFQMWVAPECRGQGLGARMLQELVDWAGARGARRVVLRVTRGNAPAEGLYRAAGFRPVGDPSPLRPGASLLSSTMQLEVGETGGDRAG